MNLIATAELPVVIYGEDVKSSQAEECCICLELFASGDRLHKLATCSHLFHASCMTSWLKGHNFCPLCKQVISAESLFPCFAQHEVHSQPSSNNRPGQQNQQENGDLRSEAAETLSEQQPNQVSSDLPLFSPQDPGRIAYPRDEISLTSPNDYDFLDSCEETWDGVSGTNRQHVHSRDGASVRDKVSGTGACRIREVLTEGCTEPATCSSSSVDCSLGTCTYVIPSTTMDTVHGSCPHPASWPRSPRSAVVLPVSKEGS